MPGPVSEQTRQKISATLKRKGITPPKSWGRTPWNKGLKTGPTGLHTKTEFKPGRQVPLEVGQKISLTKKAKGQMPSPLARERGVRTAARVHRGVPRRPEVVERIRATNIKFWAEHLDLLAECVRKAQHKPNYQEQRLVMLLQEWFPDEWLYNGRTAQVIIDRKVPDFVNVNGRKAVVELWGALYHKAEDPEVLVSHYGRYGYKASVIWAKELQSPEKLRQRLLEEIYNERG